MKLKYSRWAMAVGGIAALLIVAAVVSASPPAGSPVSTLQATGDADTVDGHHAAYSGSTSKSARANRVLWATKAGVLHFRSLPQSALNKRYVNDDRAESITADSASPVLTLQNNGTGHGLTAASTYGFGVHASGAGDASGTDNLGDLLLGGTRGEIHASGNYLNLYSNWNVNIDLDQDNNDANAGFRIWDGAENLVFRVEEDGDTWAAGTKSSLVQTAGHGSRLMYAVESAGVWFEDFGTASLLDGVAQVPFDPIFAETVNLEVDYHVFLTSLSEEPVLLFVTAKTPTNFAVRGVTLDGQPAACAFDYRITAKRLGYEEVRLDEPQLSSDHDGTREPR